MVETQDQTIEQTRAQAADPMGVESEFAELLLTEGSGLGGNGTHWLRAETLRKLRWIAILGQVTTILVTQFILGFELPLVACALTVLASVWFNIAATFALHANARLSERAAMYWLLFDLVQLCVLLALTGGVANPFVLLIIAPSTVAAATLSLERARILVITSVALIIALELLNLPLSLPDGSRVKLPLAIEIGTVVALAIGVGFIALYVRRVANEAIGMSRALAATQLALAREQRLSALGAMAAAAGHELGTPLATIALTARELEREAAPDSTTAEDLALIRTQTERCRGILASLAQSRQETEHLSRAPLLSVIEEAAAPCERPGIRIEYFIDGEVNDERTIPTRTVERRPELIHALRNLIQNAVDFADSQVWIEILHDPSCLSIHISDDGKGFRPEALLRAGEPFMTTRSAKRPSGEGHRGMGLGLFIAKTLLERSGATLMFSNQHESTTTLPGALAEIAWRDNALERIAGPIE